MNVEIEPRPGYLYVRLSGEYEEDIPPEDRPGAVARACQERNCRLLLIDSRDLAGTIRLAEYFRQGKEMAEAVEVSHIHVAIVGARDRAEMYSFLENVAINRGAILKVFMDIDRAIEWLM